MAVSLVFLIFVVFMVVFVLVPWILALVDSLQRPDAEWAQADQNKLLWVLVIVFVGIVGAVLYFAIARPALNRAREASAGPALA